MQIHVNNRGTVKTNKFSACLSVKLYVLHCVNHGRNHGGVGGHERAYQEVPFQTLPFETTISYTTAPQMSGAVQALWPCCRPVHTPVHPPCLLMGLSTPLTLGRGPMQFRTIP